MPRLSVVEPATLRASGFGLVGRLGNQQVGISKDEPSNSLDVLFAPTFEEGQRCDHGLHLRSEELRAVVRLLLTLARCQTVLVVHHQHTALHRRARWQPFPLPEVAEQVLVGALRARAMKGRKRYARAWFRLTNWAAPDLDPCADPHLTATTAGVDLEVGITGFVQQLWADGISCGSLGTDRIGIAELAVIPDETLALAAIDLHVDGTPDLRDAVLSWTSDPALALPPLTAPRRRCRRMHSSARWTRGAAVRCSWSAATLTFPCPRWERRRPPNSQSTDFWKVETRTRTLRRAHLPFGARRGALVSSAAGQPPP